MKSLKSYRSHRGLRSDQDGRLDVRDEHRARVEMDERLIALIGFDHVVFTLATMRVRIVRTHEYHRSETLDRVRSHR